jgi:hypothetical protein
MKCKFVLWVAPVALAGALAVPAAAQSGDPNAQSSDPAQQQQEQSAAPEQKSSTATPVVRERQKNQQRRIRQGVKSGELTKGETRRLEAEQGKIQADKLAAKSDGTVTPAERKQLHREQNKASRDIYRKKHNNRKQQ